MNTLCTNQGCFLKQLPGVFKTHTHSLLQTLIFAVGLRYQSTRETLSFAEPYKDFERQKSTFFQHVVWSLNLQASASQIWSFSNMTGILSPFFSSSFSYIPSVFRLPRLLTTPSAAIIAFETTSIIIQGVFCALYRTWPTNYCFFVNTLTHMTPLRLPT